jgi:hypothetical protein
MNRIVGERSCIAPSKVKNKRVDATTKRSLLLMISLVPKIRWMEIIIMMRLLVKRVLSVKDLIGTILRTLNDYLINDFN